MISIIFGKSITFDISSIRKLSDFLTNFLFKNIMFLFVRVWFMKFRI